MDVPQTVRRALDDRPVAGSVCLEAGAGVGNATRGLLDAGADRVVAVTNDADHARTVRKRLDDGDLARTAVVEADLRAIPLPDDSVEVVTAHGLFNVVAPAELPGIVAELSRVASPGCHLVVDDYEPLPDDAAVRRLFALENAASEAADGRPALTFYPADLLRRVFVGSGWAFDRRRTLLDPVPWTRKHLAAHLGVLRGASERLDDELADGLVDDAERLAADVGAESVGEMYSLAFRFRPGSRNENADAGGG